MQLTLEDLQDVFAEPTMRAKCIYHIAGEAGDVGVAVLLVLHPTVDYALLATGFKRIRGFPTALVAQMKNMVEGGTKQYTTAEEFLEFLNKRFGNLAVCGSCHFYADDTSTRGCCSFVMPPWLVNGDAQKHVVLNTATCNFHTLRVVAIDD